MEKRIHELARVFSQLEWHRVHDVSDPLAANRRTELALECTDDFAQ